MKKISCIIPAYNEEKNIANVLKAVTKTNPSIITEIIVVDDGSKDRTRNIVRQFPGVRLVVQSVNGGKSKAVATGILESSEENVMFLDADLINLETQDVMALAGPVVDNQADVTISMRKNTPWWMKMIGVDFMSGERVLPRNILMSHAEEINNLPNFSLEVFINELIIKSGLKLKSVEMSNVKNDMKWKKRGFFRGIAGELLMWVDILKTASIKKLVRQNIEMRKALIKD